ncbi:MAG: pectinesterase family protein, partial [Alistipes sp.]|nr:pectinesterase family protein [Alistipes sp.]
VKNDGKTAFYDEANAVDKYQKAAVGQTPGNWGSTVNLTTAANGFRAENIIFENSFNRYVTDEEIDDGNGRAKNTDVKTYTKKERSCTLYNRGADKIEFYNCQFLASQDTLYTGDANEYSYFYNCLIEGTTDYICGDGNAVFDQCTLSWYGYSDRKQAGVLLASKGSATYGYLFSNCTITSTTYPGIETPAAGQIGRPWNTDTEKVLFANTIIDGDLITPEGWTYMSSSYPPENCTALYEYNTVYSDGTKVDLSQRKSTVLDDISEYPMSKYLNGWTPVYLGADYSDVIEQIFETKKLNPDEYSNFDIVTTALDDVIRGKFAADQASVDAMADAIKDAISKLTKGTAPVAPDHKHTYGTEYKSDGENHWKECECGEKSELSAHTFAWVIDKEATEAENGTKHEECSICGYKKAPVQFSAMSKTDDEDEEEDDIAPVKSVKTGDDTNLMLYIMLMLISALTLLVSIRKDKRITL